MRIGLVSQWYPPEVPALVPSTWAHGLASRGHDVHVVTGVPNYPSGKVYDGYRVQPYRYEKDLDVTVHRGFLYPSHDTNPARRMLNYLSFSIGGTWASFRVRNPDVWLTNGTPATAAVPALFNRAARRGAHAMVVQDLWPDSVTQSGFLNSQFGRLANWLLTNYCTFLYKNTDAIGVISPGMRDVLKSRGVDPAKIHYTPNSVPDDHLLPNAAPDSISRKELNLPPGKLFLYAGNFGRLQNLQNLIQAFSFVPQAELVLVGSGIAENELKTFAQDIPNVTFVERQDLRSIGRYIAASDVQIVSLSDTPLLRVTMPSKFQACLAAARPILAHAAGDVANITDTERVGMSADPSNPTAAAKSIQRITHMSTEQLAEMGARARSLYQSTYAPTVGMSRIESLLNEASSLRGLKATISNG